MKIIKKENGNIEILDNEGNIAHVITGGCCVTMTPKCQDDILQLFVSGQYINIPVADVTATQLEPDAEVPFSGDIFALIALLSADFFFELAGGGGGDYTLYSNRKFNFLNPAQTAGIVQINDGNFYTYGFPVLGSQTLIDVTIEVTNAAAAGTRFVIGLYDALGNKVAQTTPLLGDTVAVQTHTFPTPVTIEPGLYYVGIMSNAAGMFVRNVPATAGHPVFGYASTTGAPLVRATIAAGLVYNATMPATMPTLDTFVNSTLPMILFTVNP